jgi:LPS-assembly protein
MADMRAAVIAVLIWTGMLTPAALLAQGAANLVADQVVLTDQNQLIASGNVTVFYQDNQLQATQITYDRASDQLIIIGPLVLRTPNGDVMTATSGTLDAQLQNGILQSARLVMDRQLQLAANQIDRRDGRYTQMTRTVASSCRVCGTGPALWDIRAERVVHDLQERQMYFENATFHIRGLPVFWLPAIRLPDPTLNRATGLLIPSQRNTTQLGAGIKLPYFITLGDHADLRVTPYVSPQTRTLELVLRRAFANGFVTVNGATSIDNLREGRRSYVFADGRFDIGGGYQLQFDVETVTDKAYLLDYDYSGKDRLDSNISVLRVTDTSLTEAGLTHYQTLRDTENNATLPYLIAQARHEWRVTPAWGGRLMREISIDSAYRPDRSDGIAGRDVARFGARGEYRRDWVTPQGLVINGQLGLRGDTYQTRDDGDFPITAFRLVPSTMVVLRWPLAQMPNSTSGARHLIEPALQLSWADLIGDRPANEDSTRSELDQANLFDRSRFTGQDAVEDGRQMATGLTWTRLGARGATSSLTLGRILRDRAQPDFSASSGLDGLRSDWLVSGQYQSAAGALVELRGLLDDEWQTSRADGRLRWQNDRIALGASYIWQGPDAGENRLSTISEWTLDAGVVLSDALRMTLDARYDVAADRPVQNGVAFAWRNECVKIDVSVSRRYTASTSVDPTTTFGISGTITGFSAGRAGPGLSAACAP